MNTKQRRILLGAVVFLIAIVLAIIFSTHSRGSSQPFTITNISKCANGINDGIAKNINTTAYSYVKAANNLNNIQNKPPYTAILRSGSCSTKQASNGVRTTSAILDSKQAGQSWKIAFRWTNNTNNTVVDLGTATLSCVSTSQLIYGDFHCTKVLNYIKYGTVNYDPIMQYTPYSGIAYNIAYDADTRIVDATILVKPEDEDNTTLINNEKVAIGIWFTQHHLNIANYTVEYAVSPQAE